MGYQLAATYEVRIYVDVKDTTPRFYHLFRIFALESEWISYTIPVSASTFDEAANKVMEIMRTIMPHKTYQIDGVKVVQ